MVDLLTCLDRLRDRRDELPHLWTVLMLNRTNASMDGCSSTVLCANEIILWEVFSRAGLNDNCAVARGNEPIHSGYAASTGVHILAKDARFNGVTSHSMILLEMRCRRGPRYLGP